MSHRFTNRLVHENSLYLRQHAHNPVDWYPWGPEALQKAAEEKKPLLISIGYAACHWCHVMEAQCFENEEIASYMNRHFINIKIDREERPDLDHIYMDAVQAISGQGGWPLNVFCTSDAKPFFGGTYYPPVPAHNRIAWPELLRNISHAWSNEQQAVEDQAARLLQHISALSPKSKDLSGAFSEANCRRMAENIMQQADKSKGGFGKAPKFPHAATIRFLFEFGFLFKDSESLSHANCSLKKMIRGGIYDHVGGGLARYSTDDDWLVPHFEKMLYDNAMLLRLLSDAYQCTGEEEFLRCLYQTMSFLTREMKSPQGGYYSALDADSEGVEGKFYVWTKEEMDALLGEDAAIVSEWFGVTPEGNWDGTNILHVKEGTDAFCNEHHLRQDAFFSLLSDAGQKLLERRNLRPRPATDDKILLGWNALLLTAFCRAFAVTGDDLFKSEAMNLFTCLKEQFFREGTVVHVLKKEGSQVAAFADDLAFWIEACIRLQEITGEQDFLREAIRCTEYMDKNYLLEPGYYSYSSLSQKDVLFPRPEYYDGALPSANAVMTHNLHFLAILSGNQEWEKRSANMLCGILDSVLRHPIGFSSWSIILMYKTLITNEIVVTGFDNKLFLSLVLKENIPNRVIQSSKSGAAGFPLLLGKKFEIQSNVYFCINNVCHPPISEISELDKKLKSLNN